MFGQRTGRQRVLEIAKRTELRLCRPTVVVEDRHMSDMMARWWILTPEITELRHTRRRRLN